MPQIHMHENKVVHVFSFYRNYTVIHSYSTGAAQSEKPGLGNKKVSTSRNPPPPARTHIQRQVLKEAGRKAFRVQPWREVFKAWQDLSQHCFPFFSFQNMIFFPSYLLFYLRPLIPSSNTFIHILQIINASLIKNCVQTGTEALTSCLARYNEGR